MKAINENYQVAFKDAESISSVDGVRIETSVGWTLIRPSGTEPLIRITVEGKTKKDVGYLMEKSKELVRKAMH